MISPCVSPINDNFVISFISFQGWDYLLPSGEQGWAPHAISHDHGHLGSEIFLTFLLNTYIFTFGKPYRSRKLGSQSLELVLAAAETHTKPEVDKIYLHVQVSNEQAKKFYTNHGFEQVGIQQDYYKKIVPHDAWVLEKVLRRDRTKLLQD